jgi:hypothetical protein
MCAFQIRIFRSIKQGLLRDLNVLACGLELNLTSERGHAYKFEGYPLNPYPWVDKNWGYNLLGFRLKCSDQIYLKFKFNFNFQLKI